MKNLIYLFVMALMAISCGKENTTPSDPTPAPQPDNITLASGTDTAPVISENGGTVTVSFTANTSWTATVNATDGWCTVSPASGNAGNGSITITVKGSTSTDIRTASVIIKAGTANQTITIVQKAKAQDDYITLAAGTDVNPTVSADGGTINVSFTTNCSWMTTVSGNSDICTVAPSSGEAGSHTITITVKENTSTVDRSRVVTIKAGSATQKIIVNQPAKAKEPDKIILADGTDNYPVVPSDGGNISISFTTNTSWSVEVVGNANWLTVTPTSGGAGSHTITINVAKNATGSTRTNNIIIEAGAKIEKIVVKQEAAGQDKITFATGTNTSPSVSADGGAVTISFATNVSWDATVYGNTEWCKVTPSSGAAGNGTITITVEKNTTANARYANVRIIAGGAVEWISLEQQPRDPDKITFATGTNTSPAVSADGGAVTISFTTNISWEAAVTTSNANWCKVTPSSGAAGNGTITITVEKNTTANARYANVRVMAGSAVEWIYIQQSKLTGNEGIKPGENLP